MSKNRKQKRPVEDDLISIQDSHQEDEAFNQLETDFFDGLLGAGERVIAKQKSEIREKTMLLTEQVVSRATTLQQKIDRKKNTVDRKIERRVRVIENQSNIQDDEVKVSTQKNNSVFVFDVEFQQLGLGKAIVKALNDMDFRHPTKVQKIAIPSVISGKDVIVSSMTGSGKTLAFLLPALQRFGGTTKSSNYSKVLIVLPTRELALQCFEMLEQVNKYVKCTASLIIGAVPIAKQEVELRKHPDIIIATPGRLVDLLKNSFSIDLQNIEMLVFDEADRLLEMGFEKEINEIIRETPMDRQTILFSATMTAGIDRLTKLALKKPIRMEVDYDLGVASGLKQYLVRIRSNQQEDREAHLVALLSKQFTTRTIVFVKTKRDCHRIAMILGLLGMKCCELHGNLSQQQRIKAFEEFKEGLFDFLLATDLAARGLDIQNVQAVINFEIPFEVTRYIHRVGRTARIGSEGVSVTLCLENEARDFKKMIRQSKQELDRLSVNLVRVQNFREKIFQLEPEIKKIIQEEFYEKELRKAEMEAQKAENLLDYREDIYRRPKKEWIESFKEKLTRQNVAPRVRRPTLASRKRDGQERKGRR